MRIFLSSLSSLAILAAASSTQAGGGDAGKLTLRAGSFEDGGTIPSDNTCDGASRTPALSWSTPPSGTQSLALLVEDPDAPKGTFTHWLVTDLPPTMTSVPEGGWLPDGARQGKNDKGATGYTGPCPPSGTHHYLFRVFALDLPKLTVQSRATFLAAIEGHVLAEGRLTGTYQKHER